MTERPLHVAVDARDLAHDWRGIARYVRAVLARFAARADVRVTLVEPGFFGQRAPRGADVVWHPWNGTFFSARVPSVVTFHDAVPFRFPAPDPRKRRNEQGPWLRSAATASAFLANSRFTVSEIERFLGIPAERQTVTYLGVERDVFAPRGGASVLPDGRPYVLFVGTLEPFKNLPTLLAAHARAFPDASTALVVAGSRPPSDARVVALGVVEPVELAAWYRGARAVAVPSLYECFGLPLLEAMSCGAPVIASRTPSLEEVGGAACAWIDDPLDVEAWSAALLRVTSDDGVRAQLNAAGLVRAGQFSWERCAEETLAVLRRTAATAVNRALGLLALGALVAGLAGRPAAAAGNVSLLDLVETEFSYTTILDQYQRPVAQQRLLDGARVGIVAYLRSRGIANPQVGAIHARADGRGAVLAIEQQIALAIQRYGSHVETMGLVYAAIRGEVAALHDPYSVFFTAAEVKGFSAAIDGTAFGGIGVQLAFDDARKQWLAEGVFDGSPAAKSGLQAGDAIVAVDGTNVTGLDNAHVEALIRGAAGTTVRLSIVRNGAPLDAPLAIVRASVTPPDVTERLLPGGVGYVALRSFAQDAGTKVRAALVRLAARGAHAYVFDLRGNGGGYESAAVHVASAFIAAGPVVANEGRDGRRRISEADGDAVPALPLAVLVDHDSASGAELVAGAIQDRHAGTLIGTRTFGKGVAQTMFGLPDGSAIKLTTARYYTAGGRFIDRTGLEPDIVVDEPAGSQIGVPGHDPQLDRALALLVPGGV